MVYTGLMSGTDTILCDLDKIDLNLREIREEYNRENSSWNRIDLEKRENFVVDQILEEWETLRPVQFGQARRWKGEIIRFWNRDESEVFLRSGDRMLVLEPQGDARKRWGNTWFSSFKIVNERGHASVLRGYMIAKLSDLEVEDG